MEKIVIYKDRIVFGDNELYPPFERNVVDNLLGEYRVHNLENIETNYRREISIWDNYGIAGYLSDDMKTYTTFAIRTSKDETINNLINGAFLGKIYIERKLYTDCKWKEDLYFSHVLKKGYFELDTFLIDEIDKVPDKFKDTAIKMSRYFEISYIEPRVKTTKYKLTKVSEPVLAVSDFNFKLAVIQVLMYEKNLLHPKFDIYEFAKEYDKREIDVDDEGYEPIKEVVSWFKRLPIPARLASEITEIIMDGGDDVYHQIIPLWDGEDDYFDIKKITSEDLSQFKNLKKMKIMSSKFKDLAKVLNENGIEAEVL